jgi:ribosomal protein S18 acetylase RimI-like enzyme
MSAEQQPRISKRVLPPSEWEFAEVSSGKTLVEVFLEEGGELPDPRFAEIHVVEIDGEIVGFGVLQLVPHLDPVWVAPSLRGNGIGVGLAVVEMVESRLRESDGKAYFCFVNNIVVKGLVERIGFKEYPSEVMYKDIA